MKHTWKKLLCIGGATLVLGGNIPYTREMLSDYVLTASATDYDNYCNKQDNKEAPYDGSYWVQPTKWKVDPIDPDGYKGDGKIWIDQIEVTQADAVAGKEIEVHINSKNLAYSFQSIGLHILYDTRLDVVKKKGGKAVIIEDSLDGYFVSETCPEPGVIELMCSASGDYNEDGKWVTLTFKLPYDADPGDLYPIGIQYRYDGTTGDLLQNEAQNNEGRVRMTYLFTKGIKNGYIKVQGEKEYTVSFDANGGSGTMPAQTVKKGDKLTLPECSFTPPTGKVFDYWMVDGMPYFPGQKADISANTKVQANWVNQTRVRFMSNGGSGSMPDIYMKTNSELTFPDCTFTAPKNHEFLGWKYNDLNSEKIYQPGEKIKVSLSDVSVYAVWAAKEYSVTFEKNGGLGSMETLKVEQDEVIILPECTFTKFGCRFDKWEIDGCMFEAGTEYQITKDTVCKATWVDSCGPDLTWKYETEIGKLTISGTGAMDEYEYADEVPWSEYTKEIMQISLPEGLTEISALAFRGSGELKSVTIPKSVTKIGSEAFGACKMLEEITILNPETELFDDAYTVFNSIGDDSKPVYNGKICGYADSSAQKYAEKYGCTFEPFAYTVSFEKNGGSGEMQNEKACYDTDFSAKYKLPECKFTAPKYHSFAGWNVNGERKQSGEEISLTADAFLEAEWEIRLCEVTFDADGAEGSIADTVLLSGTSFVFPNCTLTPPKGKKFSGWQLDGKTYQAGESVPITKDSTVKAIWETIQYTITFDANGGTGEIAAKTVLPDTDYTFAKCTFTAPEGAEFLGWQIGDQSYEVGDTIKITEDTVVKALWSEPEKTVLVGDVSGDDTVDQLDAMLLARYTAAWEGIEIDLNAADLNNDGTVDAADAIILARYAAGWDGYDQYIVSRTV